MIGVDKTSLGGMLTVIENYINCEEFLKKTNLIYIPTVINRCKLLKIVFFFRALVKILITIISKKINIIHVHMSEKSSVFREGIIILLGKLFRCKTIIHLHGATFEKWYKNQISIVQKMVRYIFNNADKVLVLGEIWKRSISNIMDNTDKIEVLYNAVNIPSNNLYSNNANNIIFLGVLIERKGIDDLLKAILKIKDDIPSSIRVKLYGVDVYGNIEEKIKSLNLERIVEYSGWINSENKKECFSHAILNILPSYNEGLPMSILETMAYGIPNISTNIAAIPEAISNGGEGILVQPGDISGISKAILQIVNNPDLRSIYSINSYKKVNMKFNIKDHIDRVYNIYSNLLK
jgi:glycosyltransferase involved in cell wall biosynthesis